MSYERRVRGNDVSNAVAALIRDARRIGCEKLSREEGVEVLKKAKEGDAKAIERAVFSMFWYAFPKAFRRTGGNYHDTLDAFQDSCIALLQAIRTWDDSYGVLWYSHARLRVCSGYRKSKKQKTEDSHALLSGFSRPETVSGSLVEKKTALDNLDRDEVLEKISELKHNQQEVIRALLAGETLEQIGEVLGFTRQNAHHCYKKAIKELQKIFDAD